MAHGFERESAVLLNFLPRKKNDHLYCLHRCSVLSLDFFVTGKLSQGLGSKIMPGHWGEVSLYRQVSI